MSRPPRILLSWKATEKKTMASTAAKLLKLIRQGESETLEFKESFGRQAIETVCAFANTKGGILLIGVDDKGIVLGVLGGAKTLKRMADEIAQATGLQPSVEAVTVKSRRVVQIQVQESRVRPVMYHGKAYHRSGSTTRRMGVEEVTRIVLSSVGMTWDEVPEIRAGMSDISTTKVKAFIRLANEKGRRPMASGITAPELLQKLKLIRKGRPTRAAILLFGKVPQDFYRSALVKVGRFRSETLIVDDREIEGTIFEQIEGVMGYFREKLDTRFVMTGRPQRDVVWEYPLEALREAVTNAVCHRDYLSTAHVQVRVYDKEVLFMNPGGLPAGLSVETLKQAHHSIPRNRQIAEALFYAGLIEHWGSGIEKMVDECSAAAMPEPVFESDAAFRLTFKKSTVTEPELQPESQPESRPESRPELLETRILRILRKGPLSKAQISEHLDQKRVSGQLNKTIRLLLSRGAIAYTIPGKPNSRLQRYRIPGIQPVE